MLEPETLLRKGYLPRELPPTFTTGQFADLYAAEAVAGDAKWTECARHNLARVGGFRRPLKVPNPRSMAHIASVLAAYWELIEKQVKPNTFSISRPTLTRTAERAIRPKYRLGEAPKLRARFWRGQRFVLYTDVGQFYSSLYTHSIPWALHTKEYAKANINKTDGDKIDAALRAASGGQTVGIPIGPDSSFVAAEVVLAAVDAALRVALGPLRGFRYLDDYELAFRSRAQAEHALVAIEGALGDYELVINPFKTRIFELPEPVTAPWTHEISRFPIRSDTSLQALNDVIGLFSHAAEAARRHPGALKYALLRSRSVRVDGRMWRTFQNLVWSAVSSEPTTMATALDLLAEKSEDAAVDVDRDGAADLIEALIATHAPLRNGSEVVWAVWAAIRLGITLSTDAAGLVRQMDDNFVALTALHASSVGVFPAGALDTARWEAQIDYDEVLTGPNWLLAYESAHQGWLEAAASRVENDDFFTVLADADVAFYDTNPSLTPFTGSAGPLPGTTIPDDYG